jgi:hypothetical protein
MMTTRQKSHSGGVKGRRRRADVSLRLGISNSLKSQWKPLLLAAAGISVVGLLTSPGLAQADRMFPLAPPCDQWGFLGDSVIDQSDGLHMTFSASGKFANGTAIATAKDGSKKFFGTVNGEVNGRTVTMTADWGNASPGGTYIGNVGEDGHVRGGKVGAVTWNTITPLTCLTKPADPQGQGPAAPAPAPVTTKCPAGGPKTEVPAGEKCPPPTNAIRVNIQRSFSLFWPVTVTNSAGIGGSCTYVATDTGGGFGHRENFDIAPNGTANFSVPAPVISRTYNVVTSCTGTYDGQQVEFGRDEQDVEL